jgi:hypothetical protein
VAELLTVMALREGVLRSVRFHLDGNVAEAWHLENLMGFCRSQQGYQEKGEVSYFGFFGRGPMGGRHLLDINNVEA